MRYFPDLTWETASDIVETAFVNEIALVRVVNNLDEATLAIGKKSRKKVEVINLYSYEILYTSIQHFKNSFKSYCNCLLITDMLRKADPPIPAEIWDSKIEEVLVI
jgi:hypothetical protein